MNNKIEQEFNEVKVKFEGTERAISRLAEKHDRLEKQLTRMNLVRQFQYYGVTRNTTSWIVNGRHELEANFSTN